MQLSLPDTVARRAEEQAAKRGFTSVSDYLIDLLDGDATVPDPFAGREAEVETALLDALAGGPAVPMTDEMWDDLHRRVREVHPKSQPPK